MRKTEREGEERMERERGETVHFSLSPDFCSASPK